MIATHEQPASAVEYQQIRAGSSRRPGKER
jgi:hypothetical protein